MKVSPKRLVPLGGCCCDWPRNENGSAFSAEFEPVQKMAPWGWLGLKPRKLPRPPLPPAEPAPPKPPAANPPPPPKPPPPPNNPPPCPSGISPWARAVSTASRMRSISRPASGLTCPVCPLMATESALKSELAATGGSAAPLAVGVAACVSVSAARALTRLRLCAPLPASCWMACAATALSPASLPAPSRACCCCWMRAREASIRSKLTVCSRLAAFSSASPEPVAKAANWVRTT